MPHTRRQVLGASALATLAGPALARSYSNELPWEPNEVYPPTPVEAGPLQFLTAEEAACLDAMVDRLIPSDDLGPGGKAAGCTTFIDRQLAGPYGTSDALYTQGPHPDHPLPTQGLQTALTPRDQYRKAWQHSPNIAGRPSPAAPSTSSRPPIKTTSWGNSKKAR